MAVQMPFLVSETLLIVLFLATTALTLLKELRTLAPLLLVSHPVAKTVNSRLPDVSLRLRPTSYSLNGRLPWSALGILVTQACWQCLGLLDTLTIMGCIIRCWGITPFRHPLVANPLAHPLETSLFLIPFSLRELATFGIGAKRSNILEVLSPLIVPRTLPRPPIVARMVATLTGVPKLTTEQPSAIYL